MHTASPPGSYKFSPTLVVLMQQAQHSSRTVTVPIPFPPQLSAALSAQGKTPWTFQWKLSCFPTHSALHVMRRPCSVSKEEGGGSTIMAMFTFGKYLLPTNSSEVIPLKTLTQPFKDSFGEYFHTTLHAD